MRGSDLTPTLLYMKGSTPDAHKAGRARRPLAIGDPQRRMEHLWSPAGATGGNRWQMGHPRKPLKQANPQPVATHGNRIGAHGKEGVDGSSPSEGLTKGQQMALFLAQASCDRRCRPVPKTCPQCHGGSRFLA